jgi:hypothetical protein
MVFRITGVLYCLEYQTIDNLHNPVILQAAWRLQGCPIGYNSVMIPKK